MALAEPQSFFKDLHIFPHYPSRCLHNEFILPMILPVYQWIISKFLSEAGYHIVPLAGLLSCIKSNPDNGEEEECILKISCYCMNDE